MATRKGKVVEDFFVSKSASAKMILFTAVFDLLFINIYKPFNSDKWYIVSPEKYLLFSFLLVLTGIIVISFSRFIMSRYAKRRKVLFYREYITFIFFEILVLSIIYSIYTIEAKAQLSWYRLEDIISVFKTAYSNTFLVLLIPYLISFLYLSYEDKKRKINEIQQVDKEDVPAVGVIQFKDERGEFRFSASSENIISIEAADNYVIIVYLNKDKVSKFMLRNSLKKLEEDLKDTRIKRCHRSYMVNFEHVVALRKDGENMLMDLDVDVQKIPVSKTYADGITEAFLKNSLPEKIKTRRFNI